MTTATTDQVLPNTRPNSVTPLVSTSMKPAPRKKNTPREEDISPFPLRFTRMKAAETASIREIISR